MIMADPAAHLHRVLAAPESVAPMALRAVQLQVLGDVQTPLRVYLQLSGGPWSYLLESVQGGETWGRYSIIGLPAREVIQIHGETITLKCRDAAPLQVRMNPLEALSRLHHAFVVTESENLPRFAGALVGYLGYDLVRCIEPVLGPCRLSDPLGTPDAMLLVGREFIVFDALKGQMTMMALVPDGNAAACAMAERRLQDLARKLQEPAAFPVLAPQDQDLDMLAQQATFSMNKEAHAKGVLRIKQAIRAGDVMQVVLSQRISLPFAASPVALYRALRCLSPAPYMYHLNLGDLAVVGASPEILVRLEQGELTERPIAGTRPRGQSAAEDMALGEELLADEKEIAEHVMLIDLGRNDLGRVSVPGSVRLTEKLVIERYAHVMHLVSNVKGTLLPGLDAIDVLKATFPAGTVSGAPKVEAMRMIDMLEPVKRGIYAGAVGYLGFNGNMDLAIAIRTGVVQGGQVHIQAGGGIVADSQPESEWQETMNKRRAFFRAIAMAQGEGQGLPMGTKAGS